MIYGSSVACAYINGVKCSPGIYLNLSRLIMEVQPDIENYYIQVCAPNMEIEAYDWVRLEAEYQSEELLLFICLSVDAKVYSYAEGFLYLEAGDPLRVMYGSIVDASKPEEVQYVTCLTGYGWDDQIEEDVESGKLDFFIEEAIEELKTKRLRDLP